MRIREELLTLKDGRTVTLRSVEEKEAEAMLDFLRIISEETHYLIRYPEEIDITLEKEKQIIRNSLDSDDMAWFTVFDGEKVIGNCSVSRKDGFIKTRHRADFAIALEEVCCGSGLGTILMEKAAAKARELGCTQMELGVYADNERAYALYRKMGFRECGRTPNAFRLKDGTYIDEINMYMRL
ncbi:MAG: GNAT family N-acetyltransferase [Lachnospiraceae bacterium]|nr:GNAT family N-acetyltransferase [Lachnospiraceae bacterium]